VAGLQRNRHHNCSCLIPYLTLENEMAGTPPTAELPDEAEKPPVDPLTAARALIEQEQNQRMLECREAVQAVLEKYGMRLEIMPAQLAIVPI
jgi:hypothetical protein